MLKFFKKNKPESKTEDAVPDPAAQHDPQSNFHADTPISSDPTDTPISSDPTPPHNQQPAPNADTPTPPETPKKSWASRLRQGLSKTRRGMGQGISHSLRLHKQIDDELFETIETTLLMADVGMEATQSIMDDLSARLKRKQLRDPDSLMQALREDLVKLLQPCVAPLQIDPTHSPHVILVVGVNGSGKTTTIGKLAKRFQNEEKNLLLAAGDTFRAAAIEQLQTWGERHNVPVVAQHSGADSASVVFDALEAAKARQYDVMIADTAGRLHTQQHLMTELHKVKRVLSKLDESAPHEVLLVLDASIGQNALQQAKQFHEAIGVTGIAITKLDGTAKGGMLFAIAKQLQIPIRLIGVGEQADDLHDFNAEEFVNALFDE